MIERDDVSIAFRLRTCVEVELWQKGKMLGCVALDACSAKANERAKTSPAANRNRVDSTISALSRFPRCPSIDRSIPRPSVSTAEESVQNNRGTRLADMSAHMLSRKPLSSSLAAGGSVHGGKKLFVAPCGWLLRFQQAASKEKTWKSFFSVVFYALRRSAGRPTCRRAARFNVHQQGTSSWLKARSPNSSTER